MTVRQESRRGFHLLDMVALVVGYSLASLLIRAFWPGGGDDLGVVALFVLSLAFVWLGMAMSGPIVLLGHRRADPETEEPEAPEARTWAELAWLVIGFYWIVLTVLVVPVRMHNTRVLDTAFLGLFPILAAVGLRFFRPAWVVVREGQRQWTHHAAVVLLVTWPAAWVALVLLGKGMP
jgi:hypothetical protein